MIRPPLSLNPGPGQLTRRRQEPSREGGEFPATTQAAKAFLKGARAVLLIGAALEQGRCPRRGEILAGTRRQPFRLAATSGFRLGL